MEPYYWMPLIAAIVYTLSSLCLKRSSQAGIGPWRTTVVWNGILAVFSLPFWFLTDTQFNIQALLPSLFISFLFFLGQVFNCMAIYKGDVSVVTPIMGIKVVFVGILGSFLLTDEHSATVWLGTILATAAIFLMRGSGKAERKRLLPSIILGLVSALSFAAFDICMQRYGTSLGYAEIVSSIFSMTFVWSLMLIPLFKSPLTFVTKSTWGWLAVGGVLHNINAFILAFVLTTYGQATKVNIVYSSRAFWSILFVWLIGHWFMNEERKQGKKTLILRILGSCLLGAALILASL